MKKRIVIAIMIAALVIVPATQTSANSADTKISDVAYQACIDYGEEYGICPELLMAMVERESSGNPNAENGSCKGLMQISTRWNADRMKRLGVTNIYNERQNIHCGADILAELAEKYGEVAYALDKYNGNSKATYNYENGIISSYAEWILERSEQLERLHGK